MPDNMSERRKRYCEAIQKALDWLAAQQGEDSAFGLTVEQAASPIMVTPLAFLWGGMPWRCLGVIERIRSSFIKEDGSLYRPAQAAKIADQRQQPYAIGWVVRSAAACGALDVAHRCVRHLVHFQHERSGGLFGTPEEAAQGEGIIDMASTGMGALAFLAAGRFSRARAAGDYVAEWLTRQPDTKERLLPQWHTQKGLLDEESGGELPPNANAPLVVGHSVPQTGYWLCGILLAFLAELYQVTGEKSYFETACEIFDFAERSPELGNVCSAHKFAWGAARLFEVSNEPRHLDGACRVADRLVRAQRPGGYFVYAEYFGPDEEPAHVVNVNVSSQFAAWVSAVAMRLPVA